MQALTDFSTKNSWLDLGGAVLVLACLAALIFLSFRLWPRLVLRLAWGGAIALLTAFWGVVAAVIVWWIVLSL